MRRRNKKTLEATITTVIIATAVTLGIYEGLSYLDKHREFITGTYIHMREHNQRYR